MKADTALQSDIDVLTALNRDYIQSVQHGDVGRFAEILADDFLCSSPDGSLVDKNQFLAQTARPVTITGLEAQDVKVRPPAGGVPGFLGWRLVLGEKVTNLAQEHNSPTLSHRLIRGHVAYVLPEHHAQDIDHLS
jgi:hypothetical protein